MNAEGIARIITPEVIQATLSGIPMLVAAFWVFFGLGILQRRTVWNRAGRAIRGVAAATGGAIEPMSFGWRVHAGGVRIDWVSTVFGPQTRASQGKVRVARDGWLDAESALGLVA